MEAKKYGRIVVLVFDSPAKAKECYNSKEYQQALGFLNDNNSEKELYILWMELIKIHHHKLILYLQFQEKNK